MQSIAQTIVDQIGKKALFMIGAKSLVSTDNGLFFRVGRNSNKVTGLQITLDENDTYSIKSFSNWGSQWSEKEKVDGVYCDMLNKTIESMTGMYTSLGRA